MALERLLAITGDFHDNKDNLQRLLEQLQVPNGIVPFVGAGMSIPFGYPGWQSFLEEQAGKGGVEKKVQRLLNKGKFEEAASDVLAARGYRAFHDAIQATFAPNKLDTQKVQAAVSLLPSIAGGPVVTTNFDHVLERVFDQAGCPFERIIWGAKMDLAAEAIVRNRRFLIKLHGDADDSTDRILTLSDYQKYYGKRPSAPALSLPLPRLLQQVVLGRALLFLGSSLNRDRTVSVLARLARDFRAVAHYAIVEQGDPFHERARYLSELNIRPIWYPKGSHHVVRELLQELVTFKQSYAETRKSTFPTAAAAQATSPEPEVTLQTLSQESPILKGAIEEVINKQGISYSTLELLLTSPIKDSSLDAFWRITIREFEKARFSLAIGVVKSIDRRNVGHKALEFCLEGDRLEHWQRENLGMHMQYATSEVALRYFHSKLVTNIRSDTYYNSFLHRHLDFILNNCYSDMAAYLLFPDRGPDSYNVDSFHDVVNRAPDPAPFLLRWEAWINNSMFDGQDELEGSESAEVLYKIFNKFIQNQRKEAYPLIHYTIQRVYLSLKGMKQEDRRKGFYHLAGMSTAKFRWAGEMLAEIERVDAHHFSIEEQKLLFLHEKFLRLISRKDSEGVDLDRDDEVRDMQLEIYEADNFSGFWIPHSGSPE